MKPWNKSEFLMEEQFEKIVNIYNKTKSEEVEQAGSCLIVLIVLCQDINNMEDEKEQETCWKSIEQDVSELISATEEFLTEQKNKN